MYPFIPLNYMSVSYKDVFVTSLHRILQSLLLSKLCQIIINMKRELYIDFSQEFENLVSDKIKDFIKKHYKSLFFRNIDISDVISILLYNLCICEKGYYCDARNIGSSISEAFERINCCIDLFNHYSRINNKSNSCHNSEIDNTWKEILSQYKNSAIVYVNNKNNLVDIWKLNFPSKNFILILTDFEIAVDIEFPENYINVEFEVNFFDINDLNFLNQNFPFVYAYIKVFYNIFSVVKPTSSYCLSSELIISKIFLILSESFVK